MLQNLIVAGIVIVAAVYLLRRWLKKGAQSSCGCGCSGCGSADACAGADSDGKCPSGLHDMRPRK